MERLDYYREVEKDAKEFLLENIDEVMESMASGEEELGDELRYEKLQENFDRWYTPEDAIYVLDNSNNEETDSGLWAGVDNWRDELNTRAAYTYITDVRESVDKIYKDAYEEFENAADELNPESDDFDEKQKDLAKSILSPKVEENIEQVESGSEEEREILSEWLRLNREVGMRGGYPLGGSYIDARCGVGFGQPDQYEYVMNDHRVAKQIPHLAGKFRDAVREYFEKTFEKIPATC